MSELDKQLVEKNSAKLMRNLNRIQGPYNVYRGVVEVQKFLEVVDKKYHLTLLQREHLKKTRMTMDKVFEYKQ
jgi:hypothetical protein